MDRASLILSGIALSTRTRIVWWAIKDYPSSGAVEWLPRPALPSERRIDSIVEFEMVDRLIPGQSDVAVTTGQADCIGPDDGNLAVTVAIEEPIVQNSLLPATGAVGQL